ncbi:MAG: ABC transporter substrate-binding protein, partial [Magnetococcales bacterium]|nr:ABC transporter substrate-binding protein [Magnetococcales bacterium]
MTLSYQQGDKVLRLVVVAPLSGADQLQGQSIQRGIELMLQQINQAGGVNGGHLEMVTIDENGPAERVLAAVQQATAAEDVVGIIGHWYADTSVQAVAHYGEQQLPALLLTNAPEGILPVTPWSFRPLYDESAELRFLANYVRNVVGDKTVFVLHEDNARGHHLATAFDEVYQRFGTKILYKWAVTADVGALQTIVAEINDKKLSGTYLVLGDVLQSARMIAALRQGGIRQRIVGMRHLATKGFLDVFSALWQHETISVSA